MQPYSSLNDQRLLPWEACINTRELGGYPVAGGGQTRWKTLLRSDNLALLTPEGQQRLLDYDIRTVIDLRFGWELKETPNPFAASADHRITFLHLPLDEDVNPTWPHPSGPEYVMSDMYTRMAEKNRNHIAAVLTAIARARPGGVLFHCYAGKDRTGMISALVLSAIGVPREIVIADYSFDSGPLAAWRKNILYDPSLPPERRDYMKALISTYPETMQHTLEYLDAKYGSVKGYLSSTPLEPKILDLLYSRLVE